MPSKERYGNDAVKYKKMSHDYYMQNKEKILAKCKIYNRENKEKIAARSKIYYENHIEKVRGYNQTRKERRNERSRENVRRTKLKIINGYGGVCTCCGETAFEFLTVEHVNGDGKEHRKKRPGNGVYIDIIKENYPPKYTILCMNCNFSMGKYGYCPHKKD